MTASTETLKLFTVLLSMSCEICLISLLSISLLSNLYSVWIVSENSVFQLIPQKWVRGGWNLGNRLARGYWFYLKWVCLLESTAWGIKGFCSSNEVALYLAGTPKCSYQCLSSFSMQNKLSSHHLDVPCCIDRQMIPINVFKKVWPKAGSIIESKNMHVIFQKKGKKRTKKGIIFENLGKNLKWLTILWKRAASCVRLSHAWNS